MWGDLDLSGGSGVLCHYFQPDLIRGWISSGWEESNRWMDEETRRVTGYASWIGRDIGHRIGIFIECLFECLLCWCCVKRRSANWKERMLCPLRGRVESPNVPLPNTEITDTTFWPKKSNSAVELWHHRVSWGGISASFQIRVSRGGESAALFVCLLTNNYLLNMKWW